ncbi:hypothetical protein J5226_02070 [Lysobacter sp. K5869]|uniref:hypothetical protein n=1 Tax=Lysobacter sp. K5869 TaxID=2820808 RepID=UPI001C061470|nr:hypothetical protein [Lysobacter sp. K5869]QWP77214.1 hypothetical protein J5226_02070 [Lysobacter sp. K5869]
MKHTDFAIGTEFETCTGQRWRCTDVGQRSIVAIELRPELHPAWSWGPPYPVPEVTFDELDIAAVLQSQEDAIQETQAETQRSLHPGYPHPAAHTMMKARCSDDTRSYPRPRLLRIDRVDDAGEIYHPYAVELTNEGWRVLLYAPFTEAFSVLAETDFFRMRPASSWDFEARKHMD